MSSKGKTNTEPDFIREMIVRRGSLKADCGVHSQALGLD